MLLAATLALGFAGSASAALFEIPGPVSDPLYGSTGRTQASGIETGAFLQAAAFSGTGGAMAPAPGVAAHKAVYEANAGLHAVLDAPYAAGAGTPPVAAEQSDPDLWTILIVIAGLIAYQLRRKSRAGAIRIRPD